MSVVAKLVGSNRPPLARYGVAVVVTAAFVGLDVLLQPVVGRRDLFLLIPGVVLAAWYGGRGPGLLSAVASVAAAKLLFYAPVGTLRLDQASDALDLAVFMGVAVLVSSTTDALRRERNRARETAERLREREEQRREAEKVHRRLAAIVESSHDAILGKTLDGTITSWNRGAERMYGYTADEIIGRNVEILVPPEIDNDVPAIMQRLRRGEHIENHETIRRTRGGRRLLVSVTISPLADDQGNLIGASTIARDITSHKEAIEELRHQQQETAKARDEAEQEAQRLAALQSATAALVAATTEEEVAEALIREGAALLGASGGALIVPDEDASWMLMPVSVGLPGEVLRRWPMRDPDSSPSLHVMRAREPLFLESLADLDDRYPRLRTAFEQAGTAACAYLPLVAGDEVLGTVAMAFSKERTFSARERGLLRTLAELGGYGLDRARIHRAEVAARERAEQSERRADEARVETERAAERLRVLAEGSRVLTTSLADERPFNRLQRLADFVAETFGDYCATYVLQEDGSIRRTAVSHRDPDERELARALMQAPPPRLDDDSIGAVIRTGQTLHAPDVPAERIDAHAQDGAYRELLHRLAPRSSVVVPLRVRDRTIGALAVATTGDSVRKYTDEDRVLMEHLAERAALLVDNALLYHEAQQAIRARDDMVASVSHDLKNPLHAILTVSKLLEKEDLPYDKRRQYVGRVVRATHGMSRFIQDLLDVNQMESGKLSITRQPVDMRELLSDVCAQLEPIAEEKSAQIDTDLAPDLPTIEGDRSRLHQVVSNLLGNALKYIPEGGRVRLWSTQRDGTLRIAIADDGPGIPAEQLPHLFDRFWRARNVGNKDGSGLGLAIAKGVVEAHGGTIDVESREGKGSTFEVAIPLSHAA